MEHIPQNAFGLVCQQQQVVAHFASCHKSEQNGCGFAAKKAKNINSKTSCQHQFASLTVVKPSQRRECICNLKQSSACHSFTNPQSTLMILILIYIAKRTEQTAPKRWKQNQKNQCVDSKILVVFDVPF